MKKSAQNNTYPEFMSPEHIDLVMKRVAQEKITNGRGSGLQPYASFLSSPDEAPLSILTSEEGGEYV